MSLAFFQQAPDHWERTTLGDIVERGGGSIQTGPFGSQLHASDYVPTGIPSIMPVNIGDNRVIPEGIACIREEDAQRLSKHILRAGDIIYSRRGDVERRALIRESEDGWFCGTGCLKVRLGDNVVDPEFASYYLGYPDVRSWLVRHAVGATMPNLNTSLMSAIPFLRPPIREQRAIAGVLGALDDKIEQNRRTSRALERMARAIFRAWFVDFEPVKAKAAGETASGGFPSMPQEVFDALPTRLVDSQIGPVPEGWEVVPIDDVVTVKGGGTPSTKNHAFWEGGTHCWATPKDLSRLADPVLLDTDRHITEAGAEKISSGVLPAGTVLMSSRAPVGYLAIAAVPTAVNQGFIAMICDGPLPPTYVLNWAEVSMETIKARASGTTFAEISKKNFRPIPVVVPDARTIAAFRGLVEPLFDLLMATVRETRQLAAMRDLLLPKLLSGEVRVRDAERWVEEADNGEATMEVADRLDGGASGRVEPSRADAGREPVGDASREGEDGGDAGEAAAWEDDAAGVAVEEAEEPAQPAGGERPGPIDAFSTEQVMAAFRKVTRNRGGMSREELLKLTSEQLGYQRLGPAIREGLKNHLRAAIRRKIIAADGPGTVAAETRTMADYELDELVDTLRSVMRKGQAWEREDAIRAVADYLGFARVRETVRGPVKSAITAALRRGILERDRDTIRRAE